MAKSIEEGLPEEPPAEPAAVAPTTPIQTFESDAWNFYKFLVEDFDVPQEIRKTWFGFLNKEAALTFLTERERMILLLAMEDASTAYIMTKPPWRYSFEEEHELTQIRARFRLKVSRSLAGFERKMQATQIIANVMEGGEQATPSGGILGRLARFIRGGR